MLIECRDGFGLLLKLGGSFSSTYQKRMGLNLEFKR